MKGFKFAPVAFFVSFFAFSSFASAQKTRSAGSSSAELSTAAAKVHTSNSSTKPIDIVVLPRSPLLGGSGHQLYDPGGNSLWLPEVRQQRDKHGGPCFDKGGKPIFQTATEFGYDEHGKHIRAPKIRKVKTVELNITDALFEVDGFIVRKGVAYQTSAMKYLDFYAPGVGIVLASSEPFPGSTEQKGAITGSRLTIRAYQHDFTFLSDKPIMGHRRAASLYVAVDPSYTSSLQMPSFAYANERAVPQAWGAPAPQNVTVNSTLQVAASNGKP